MKYMCKDISDGAEYIFLKMNLIGTGKHSKTGFFSFRMTFGMMAA